ncbi:DDE-type integrase/transposase/recombinase, partial [Alloprevotella rava]
FDDLLNTTPKLKPTHFGQLCVADITYVATQQGWAYLSLVTDAASRVIVGWQLHPTLSKDGPIEAMKKAIDFYRVNHVNLTGLIHHSDRGTQYCCNEIHCAIERPRNKSQYDSNRRPSTQCPSRENQQHRKERMAL